MKQSLITLILHDGKERIYVDTWGVSYDKATRDEAVGEVMIQLGKRLIKEGQIKTKAIGK